MDASDQGEYDSGLVGVRFPLIHATTELQKRRRVWLGIMAWSLFMVWLSVASGIQGDYGAYIGQWKLVLSGANPWATNNAYGPLHNIFAYIIPFDPLAPKLFFALALIGANALLVRELSTKRISWSYALVILTNCSVIITAFFYGDNDTLVAAMTILAIVERNRNLFVSAGCLLGFAVILKYYPIFLVPFFALERGHFRWKVVVAASAVIALGMLASFLVWGHDFVTAVVFGARRGPNLLSILSSLDYYPSLIGGPAIVGWLIRLDTLAVVAVAVTSVSIAWKMRMHWLVASVWGFAAILLTYKVGNTQYYLPWFFLVASLPIVPDSGRVRQHCLPLVLFLSMFQLGYVLDPGHYSTSFAAVRWIAGFLAFPIQAVTVIGCIRVCLRNNVSYGSAQATALGNAKGP